MINMGNDLFSKDDQSVLFFLKNLDDLLKRLEQLFKNYKPVLDGERYLDDKELALRLKVSRRTLQEYRADKRIPYYRIGGKVLYKESDIQQLLENNYKKPSKYPLELTREKKV